MHDTLSRRNLIKRIGWSASFLSFSEMFGQEDYGFWEETTEDVPRGVASGDPTQTSVVLWVGLPPRRQFENVMIKWEISKTPFFDRIVQHGIIESGISSAGNAQLEVTDLEPGTTYFYRFYQADLARHAGFETSFPFQSRLGRTKTLGQNPKQINFSFLSCFDYTNGYFTALAALAKQNYDFIVSLGDNIYETGSAIFQKKGVRKDTIGGGTAKTLQDYRNKYRLYFMDPNLLEARALFPWFTLWDDHEFYNNFPGTKSELEPERMSSVYAVGRRAFYEFNPISNDRKEQTYFKRSFGELADFYFLDQRSFRSLTPCLDTVSFGCQEMESAERTLLGKQQLNWLMSELAQSPAKHKVIANETMIMPMSLLRTPQLKLHLGGPLKSFAPQLNGLYANLDAWDGFPTERSVLLESIAENQVGDVLFCTGDIHTGVAGRVHRDPLKPKTSAVVAHEIVTPSVTSATFADFISGPGLPLINGLLRTANPHYQSLDTVNHGFMSVKLQKEGVGFQQISPSTTTSATSNHFSAMQGYIRENRMKLEE